MSKVLSRARNPLLWAALLPLALVVAHLRIHLGSAEQAANVRTDRDVGAGPVAACEFPGQGAERRRLVVVIVDSLRSQTALDPSVMPWLAAHRRDALWGHMRPCLSQLSLLCFRTIFEGAEPLLVTGVHNFSGMNVQASSLVHRLAERGVRVAAVADQAFIKLYQSSLYRHATFEERPKGLDRDSFGRQATLSWLADPSLDVIVSHVIDTDATAHRVGVGAPEYVAKFREADVFLADVASRLAPRDSLFILGDHGHDARGYHSSGVPSGTAYFATGPWFPGGVREDLDMASAYFLMGVTTCEATPPLYTGQQPFDALSWPAPVREAFRRASPPPTQEAAPADLGLDLQSLALGVVLLAALLGALGGMALGPIVVAAVGLAAAGAVAVPLLFGLTAVSAGALTLRQGRFPRRAVALVALALGVGLAGGLLSPWVIVTLQSNVNPAWTVGLWAGLAVLIVVIARLARRWLELPPPLSLGFTAWALLLYALFLGPYYYGAVRLLPFGTAALLCGFVWVAPHSERASLVRWLALAVLPTLPALFPVLKEWQPRWVMLAFLDGRGPVAVVVATVVALGAAVGLSPDRTVWTRPVAALAGLLVIGLTTDLPGPTLLGAVLLSIAYVGWTGATRRLADVHPAAGFLVPIGQGSFALSLLFVLLGGYRFAGVDFRFALALSSVGAGEGRAMLIAVPLCVVKYLIPIALLLWSGPRVDGRAAVFVFLRVLVVGAGLVGMQLAGSPSLLLFKQLQSQELVMTVLVYAVVAISYVVRPRSASVPS